MAAPRHLSRSYSAPCDEPPYAMFGSPQSWVPSWYVTAACWKAKKAPAEGQDGLESQRLAVIHHRLVEFGLLSIAVPLPGNRLVTRDQSRSRVTEQRPFLNGEQFDQETIPCPRLRRSNSAASRFRSEPSTTRPLANKLVELANTGERHPDRLCEGALKEMIRPMGN
jgi:hypothetical protein